MFNKNSVIQVSMCLILREKTILCHRTKLSHMGNLGWSWGLKVGVAPPSLASHFGRKTAPVILVSEQTQATSMWGLGLPLTCGPHTKEMWVPLARVPGIGPGSLSRDKIVPHRKCLGWSWSLKVGVAPSSLASHFGRKTAPVTYSPFN